MVKVHKKELSFYRIRELTGKCMEYIIQVYNVSAYKEIYSIIIRIFIFLSENVNAYK